MKIDMSAGQVTKRLEQTSRLRRLCLSLGKGRPVAKPAAPSKA